MPDTRVDVEKEYEKNDDLKREQVEQLMKWSQEQKQLPELSELQVILFLQSCYYDLKAAEDAIETFFDVKRSNPKIFSGAIPTTDGLKVAMELCLIVPLPKLTRDGYRVIFVKLMDDDPSRFNYADFIKLFDMVIMLMLHQEGTAKGHITIVDQSGFGFRHITKIGLGPMKTSLYYIQEALPVRIKGLHYFNTHSIIDKVLMMMRPFVKKQLMDMLKVHSNIKTMYDYIQKECLPSDYGGTAGSLIELHEAQKRNLIDNVDFFEAQEKQVYSNIPNQDEPKADTKSLVHRTLQSFGLR